MQNKVGKNEQTVEFDLNVGTLENFCFADFDV